MFPREKTYHHLKFLHQPIDSYQSESGRFYITPDGEFPSVTTALKHLTEKDITKWRNKVGEEEAAKVSEKASGRGNLIHEMCEMYLKNEHLKLKTQDKFKTQRYTFDQLKTFLHKIDKVHGVELGLWSRKLKVAGRTDCIAEYNGVLSVIDFKTSKKIKKAEWIEHYFIQEAAYAVMYEERIGIPVPQLVTLIANDVGQPQEFIMPTKDYITKMEIAINTFYKIKERELVLC